MLKIECCVCGTPLNGVADDKIHIVFGGKGSVTCECCKAQIDKITSPLSDMRKWLRPWGLSIAGVDVPYVEEPEPDFEMIMPPDVIPEWSE